MSMGQVFYQPSLKLGGVRRSGASTNMTTRMFKARLLGCKTLDKVTANIDSTPETSTLTAFLKEVRTYESNGECV